jgi:hypothetical protein
LNLFPPRFVRREIFSPVSAAGGHTFEPIIPPERAIKEWVPDDEPPDLWDQTAEFPSDWNQCRNPELRETDLGDGRILVPCFD